MGAVGAVEASLVGAIWMGVLVRGFCMEAVGAICMEAILMGAVVRALVGAVCMGALVGRSIGGSIFPRPIINSRLILLLSSFASVQYFHYSILSQTIYSKK